MDRDEAMLRLPHVYATVLRLSEAGLNDDEVAERLEMSRQSVPRLLRAAERRLELVQQEDRAGEDSSVTRY